ncbi:MerR family transcriptional regulator [Amycolatopsis sp.]|uniref:MerR family transcriptional regulator n=1 Tax=Amycolatopsis sp. TaxID=37632 RepID=UPI002C145747|nr:MerR family transcriptional regulator [Amycolatopsis sp.]HVV09124.1 MerR family transcriptional regulator [Amycolatopsis sp.]
MELLTIGAFARAARLSPKALRLYDELGLLRPAVVDPSSGYRRYHPDQLEQARLVAWLRRLGMPLARIRTVCALTAPEAAEQIAAFWREIEADTAARGRLASFLVQHLSRKEPVMPLTISYAVRTDQGLVRESNQDVAYAGPHLLAVADGFGAENDDRLASAAAVEALRPLDTIVPADELLNVLNDAISRADNAVRALDAADVGTTLTALHWSGSQLALVHIGDSRVYLLRAEELFQITHDHTLVQAMIDEGRLTTDEATSHPQRTLLVKALHGGQRQEPDIQLLDAEAGDRYLLCSDGLHAALDNETVRRVLQTTPEPEDAVRELVRLANDTGGADNVACVVADVRPSPLGRPAGSR